jgi:GTPase
MIERPFRCGFASIIGWTNVGKSTLVNRLTGMDVSIVSPVPQTTRNRILGLANGENYQIALIDTPGIHRASKELSRMMMRTSWHALEGVNAVVWMVFPDREPSLQYHGFAEALRNLKAPLIIAINKVDTIPAENTLPMIAAFDSFLHPAAIIPISASKGDNVDELIKVLVDLMPEGSPVFSVDEATDKTERFMVSEIIRKHIMGNTYQEIPHSVAVEIEAFKEIPEKALLQIDAIIYVEKDSQKGIVIGGGGTKLKQIGANARKDIEKLMNIHVNLQLLVKVSKDWRNNLKFLKQQGLLED